MVNDMLTPTIEFEKVAKVYETASGSSIKTVHDVSFRVEARELVTLLGPSGCGKTTMLSMVAGLTNPTSGEVKMNGVKVHDPRPNEVALVFQEPNLLPWRTALQNVRYGLELRKMELKKATEISRRYLGLVGLTEFENYFPLQLSGGMAQRVSIARALALETDIMLLDEPFGALDENTRTLLGEELLRIKSITDKTMLFVTHSIEEAIHLSDRVIVLSARPGQIKDDIKIELSFPRTMEIRCSPEFQKYKARIWYLLKDEFAMLPPIGGVLR